MPVVAVASSGVSETLGAHEAPGSTFEPLGLKPAMLTEMGAVLFAEKEHVHDWGVMVRLAGVLVRPGLRGFPAVATGRQARGGQKRKGRSMRRGGASERQVGQ